MVKTPSHVSVDISGLPAQVSSLITRVNIMSAIGAAAIIGGAYIANEHSKQFADIKETMGEIKGTIGGPTNDKLDEILKRLTVAAVGQQKQTEKAAPSTTGWIGVDAKAASNAAVEALGFGGPNSTVWVRASDQSEYNAIISKLKAAGVEPMIPKYQTQLPQ